jgi:hypothetical protein
MIRRRANAFVAFLRSPGILPPTLVVTLFLKLFADRDLHPDVFGRMYVFIEMCFWLCVAISLGLLLHFSFDRLTDWLARPEDPRSEEKTAPPAAMFRRQ